LTFFYVFETFLGNRNFLILSLQHEELCRNDHDIEREIKEFNMDIM